MVVFFSVMFVFVVEKIMVPLDSLQQRSSCDTSNGRKVISAMNATEGCVFNL